MAGGGDRQELGQALDDPQQQRLQVRHGGASYGRGRKPAAKKEPVPRSPAGALDCRRCALPPAEAFTGCSPRSREPTAGRLMLVAAPAALADNGVGLAGPTTDKTVTFFCFGVIAFFAVLVIVLSLIQGRLEKRKEQRRSDLERYG